MKRLFSGRNSLPFGNDTAGGRSQSCSARRRLHDETGNEPAEQQLLRTGRFDAFRKATGMTEPGAVDWKDRLHLRPGGRGISSTPAREGARHFRALPGDHYFVTADLALKKSAKTRMG